MKRIAPLFALLLAALAPASLRAQAPAQADEVAAVRAVIDQMFNGMRAGDSTAVRTAFAPGARLQSTMVRPTGETVISTGSLDDFVRAVGTPHTEVWDERISGVEIRVDGPLAQAWMAYSFYRGEQFSHCGVNAFQFFRSAEGWKVIQIIDTRRRDQCLPEERAGA